MIVIVSIPQSTPPNRLIVISPKKKKTHTLSTLVDCHLPKKTKKIPTQPHSPTSLPSSLLVLWAQPLPHSTDGAVGLKVNNLRAFSKEEVTKAFTLVSSVQQRKKYIIKRKKEHSPQRKKGENKIGKECTAALSNDTEKNRNAATRLTVDRDPDVSHTIVIEWRHRRSNCLVGTGFRSTDASFSILPAISGEYRVQPVEGDGRRPNELRG